MLILLWKKINDTQKFFQYSSKDPCFGSFELSTIFKRTLSNIHYIN